MPAPEKKISRRGFLGAMASGLVLGAGGAAFAQHTADDLQLEKRELRLPYWDADGFRVGLVGDLHMNRAEEAERASRAVRMLIEQKPDLIVIAGDFVDSSRPNVIKNISGVLNVLGDASCPKVAVLGNHDYWCAEPSVVIEALGGTPVDLLRNETREIAGVTVCGVDDAIAGRDKYDFFPKGTTSKSLLAVLHEPDSVENMPDHVSLQVSGHSHGGQICLPFGVPLHTPKGARKYRTGFYKDATVPLYVTRGVGTTGPDYRLFCPPEVSILTLRSA